MDEQAAESAGAFDETMSIGPPKAAKGVAPLPRLALPPSTIA